MAGRAASNKEHPLAGVVLCFTSISAEERTELASIASQMGASHKLDLTSDVTHLLVGETNTPKYKFVARERTDVVVLKPEWVEAVRQSWMQGEDTDIRVLEEQYKFPTFGGLAICLTGFEELTLRNYISDTATLNGADFRKDLTKTVTHLIARSPEGEKYRAAMQWNIKVVSLKWFTDSIERGMILEESLYSPLLPPEKQGIDAWNRSLPAVREKPQENESSSNPRPRKLRRIASAKLGDQNEGIWGDIMGTGFGTGESKRSTEGEQRSDERTPRRSASKIQVAKSFASESTFAAPSQSRELPPEPIADRRSGFLDDCFFLIHGFSSKQTNVLRDHLSFNGAQLVASMSEFSRPDIPKGGHGLYIIVPYKAPRSAVPSTDDLAFECEVVTDIWLERCLDAKTLVPPESYIANTPIPSFPVNGFSGMKICSTGFSRIDLLHLSKLVNLVGATYNEYLTPKSSVLICNDLMPINHEKLRHTHEWGVPAVSAAWFWTSIQREKKQSFEPYLIRNPSTESTSSSKDLELGAGSRPEKKQHIENNLKAHTTTSNGPRASKTRDAESIPEKRKASQQPEARNEALRENKSSIPDRRRSSSASTSQPKPTSPTKPQNEKIPNSPSAKRKLSAQSAASAIESAVSGLLKQAHRAASSRSNSETGDPSHDRIRSRRPRPLLGRAPSTEHHNVFSRASSIDTLNEDGCGSAVESVGASANTNTNVNAEGIPPLANSGRFEYPEVERGPHSEVDQESPPMTQLDYEDPDAVAMREKFLRHAGKLVEKPANKQQMVIGEVKELGQVGWGNGRRTRNANKVVVDLDDDF